ncbi:MULTISPECIES: helix-turn-helix transcriptional regulator [Comamonas]|uniref:Helix-turn-helix transcriptional regulator n=1 Tax=Comamonas sediminis TaxID=1783360 RepID=A0ABV4B6E5_9BURK|nr:helix-turn-helix domain-containing protein [Comamonas sp.]
MPRQNTPPSDYPQAVLQQIEKLGQNIAIARKRRGESQAQWAKRLGISQPTMARIERGDPSVAMASYVMCMWLINPKGDLAELIAPQNDHAALEREIAKARTQRKSAAPRRSAPPVISPQPPAREQSLNEQNVLRTFHEHPTSQLAAAVQNKPAERLAATAQKLAINRLANDLSSNHQALLALHDSKAFSRFKEASDIASGLAALMAKTAPKKP